MKSSVAKSVANGVLASGVLLGVYSLVLTLVSGWSFTLSQFSTYGTFVVSLAVGFGIQIALYSYLRAAIHNGEGMGKVVGVFGTTSTAAMISCCTHYLATLVPILGITGAATFVAAYQVQIFWVGLAFNLFGIAFISNRIIQFKKHHE